MGSAASRANKVSPALVTEQHAPDRLFNTTTTPSTTVPTTEQRSTQPHSGDRASDKLEDEVAVIPAACENTAGGPNKSLFHKVFFSSQTCGLCYSQPRQSQRDSGGSDVITPAHSEAVNTCNKQVPAGSADPVCTKAALVPGLCDHSSPALPIFYDASEEDLMNTIEREFG